STRTGKVPIKRGLLLRSQACMLWRQDVKHWLSALKIAGSAVDADQGSPAARRFVNGHICCSRCFVWRLGRRGFFFGRWRGSGLAIRTYGVDREGDQESPS